MQAEKNWYAIGINVNWRKKVPESLHRKKIETYFPVNRVRQSLGPKDSPYLCKPLFDNLCFVHIAEPEIAIVKQIDGVHHIYYWLNNYAIIDRADIEVMKVFLNLYYDVWFEKASVSIENSSSGDSRNNRVSGNYTTIEKTEKILLPTLGYYLLAQVQLELKSEILQRAI